MGKAFTIIAGIIVAIALGVWLYRTNPTLTFSPSPSYSASPSVSVSPTVMPSQTMTPGKENLIKITLPTPNSTVKTPLLVTGQARGTWYFEASFPVKIYDANGNLLGATVAQAQSDWMTTNFVPFKATLNFTTPTTSTGTLVLEKDNPSGLPQNDDSLVVPIRFY